MDLSPTISRISLNVKKDRFFKRVKKIYHANGMQKNVGRVLLILHIMDLKTRRIIRDRETFIMINEPICEEDIRNLKCRRLITELKNR